MNLTAERRDYEAAGSLADELPYWGWLRDQPYCLTRSGELFAVARLEPAVLDGHTAEQIDAIANRWHRLLSSLDPHSRLYFYLTRRPGQLPEHPDLTGVAGVAQENRRNHLLTRIQDLLTYVVWCHDPQLSQVTNRGANGGPWWRDLATNWVARRKNPNHRAYLAAQVAEAGARFAQLVDASAALVNDVTPITILDGNAATAFLSELINRPGLAWHGDAAAAGLNWRLALSELEAEREHLRLDGQPVILYSLLSPPVLARANLLHDLNRLNACMTVSLEWRPAALDAARRKIRSAQRHYFSKRYSMMAHLQETEGTSSAMEDSAAAVESERLSTALIELEANGVAYGDLALTVALHHNDLNRIEHLDAEIRRIFASADAKVIREGYGQLPAWFGRMPAQPRRRQIRTVFASAGTAGCLAPLFGPPSGRPMSQHLKQPTLATFETPWQTAYHYDLFAGDVGHTLVLGATGAGKSFTLNFLLVQALQYNPRVLILDLGGSYRWLTQFLGGSYLELSPDRDAETGRAVALRPFSLPPGERTYQFLTGWVTRLLRLGGYDPKGADLTELRARVEDVYAFEPQRRRLSAFVSSLPRVMWPAMSRWHGDGTWAAYFDAPGDDQDELRFGDWQVIDLAGAAEHEDLCEAALFYLLERMRMALDATAEAARVKLMVVDEAWRYLKDPSVLAYLSEAAKTWRKRNAALVLATQSAGDVTATPGAQALLESMPTKLFLANPDLPAAVADVFRLNEAEMHTIRGLIPKREMYLRRATAAAVLRLDVDPESYWLYTSSPLDAERRAAAVAEHGLAAGLRVLASHQRPGGTR